MVQSGEVWCSQEKWGTVREELGEVRQQWGAVQKEWGVVMEEWGTTHLLSGCTWHPHLTDKDMEQWKVPVCPSQGLGVHKGLDLGVHKATVTG